MGVCREKCETCISGIGILISATDRYGETQSDFVAGFPFC